MSVLKWFSLGLACLAVAVLVWAQFGLLRGREPTNLGLREGKLKPPSKTPNSVSSQADSWPDHAQRDYARIAPLPLRGGSAASMARLHGVLQAWPGATVVRNEPGYLYAQFSTRMLKFTDDAEFVLDEGQGVIHLRSASRLGRKDFGVNRQRAEALRSAYNAAN